MSENINKYSETGYLDSEGARNVALVTIQAAELDALVSSGRAILPEIPGFYYGTPAGFGQRAFLRVGNIQGSRAAIDAIFFWLLPYLSKCRGIIAETWSIGSVALNVSRRLAVYSKERRPCPVELLADYVAESDHKLTEAGDTVEHMLEIASEGGHEGSRVVFLQSAVSTGSLYNRLRSALFRRNIQMNRLSFVAIFNVGASSPEFPCLRDFSIDEDVSIFTPFDIKKAAIEKKIGIDPHTYFVSQYEDIEKTVRIKEVLSFHKFLRKYSSKNSQSLFRVHKTDEDGSYRHHSIWIDTLELLKDQKFIDTLIEIIDGLSPRPSLLLTPGHVAGREMAGIVSKHIEKTGERVTCVHHPDLDFDDELIADRRLCGLIDGISHSRSLLILDDCFITGLRLRTFQKHMRRRAFKGPVQYVVGVARPPTSAAWTKAKRMLEYPHNTVECVAQLLLPDYDETNCPWCVEQQVFQRSFQNVPVSSLSPLIAGRKELLEHSVRDGLTDNLFLHPVRGKKLDFQRDSIFAAKESADALLFSAVSSAIQALRNQEAPDVPLGQRRYPICTIFNQEEYLKHTFNESRIRACIIRALRDYEMIYTDTSKEEYRTRLLMEIMLSEDPVQNDLIMEILIAKTQRKFPLCDADQLKIALSQAGLTEDCWLLLEEEPLI